MGCVLFVRPPDLFPVYLILTYEGLYVRWGSGLRTFVLEWPCTEGLREGHSRYTASKPTVVPDYLDLLRGHKIERFT